MEWLKNPSFIRKWLRDQELRELREFINSLEQKAAQSENLEKQVAALKKENRELKDELYSPEMSF